LVGAGVETAPGAHVQQFFVGLDIGEPAQVNFPGVHMIASLTQTVADRHLHYAVFQEHLAYDLDE